MKPCAFHVETRQYGEPGPCQSNRAIQRVQVGDTQFYACIVHRQAIKGGKQPRPSRSVR